MVKKRLSDLIQEEAEKLTTNENESVIEVTAQEVTEQDTSAAAASPTQTPEPTAAKRTIPTKADLEIIIKELKETLEKKQDKEKSLQQQIADLQSNVSEQKASTEKLTKELQEAKKAAIHLAEANSQLIEENNSLKQEREKELLKQEKEKNLLQQEKENKSAIQVKEKYDPMGYRKSHRVPEHLLERQKEEDDFAANTWLYD
ncbi:MULTISPECIES: hypothetical protein [unclassified Anabaena]|uniref:hypothetical protein n=1 Tax=unclassified Anabaena TaxID=2619674 RepID=UPI0039C74835